MQTYRARLDLASAGADGRTSWSWEAAELAALICSATTPAMPPVLHLHRAIGIVLVFSYLVPISPLVLEQTPPALTRKAVLKQFHLSNARLI